MKFWNWYTNESLCKIIYFHLFFFFFFSFKGYKEGKNKVALEFLNSFFSFP